MRARTSRHARKHAMHAHRPQKPHCRYGTRYEHIAALIEDCKRREGFALDYARMRGWVD